MRRTTALALSSIMIVLLYSTIAVVQVSGRSDMPLHPLALPQPSCPDGTNADDVIVCANSPPTADNTDRDVMGFLGEDHITINAEVTVQRVFGEKEECICNSSPSADGAIDTIINNGVVEEWIYGDMVYEAIAAPDIIINNGVVENPHPEKIAYIIGEYMYVGLGQGASVGGDDHITNNGLVMGAIYGDGSAAEYAGFDTGGDDTIINNGTVAMGGLAGIFFSPNVDGTISGDGSWTTAGNDTIINNAGAIVEGQITGDSTYGVAGQDNIINAGIVGGNIFGDIVFAAWGGSTISEDGAADVITNSGEVGGEILAKGGDDIVNLQPGATGGDDHILPLDGGLGDDTTEF